MLHPNRLALIPGSIPPTCTRSTSHTPSGKESIKLVATSSATKAGASATPSHLPSTDPAAARLTPADLATLTDHCDAAG
jgi:hypothetical protein